LLRQYRGYLWRKGFDSLGIAGEKFTLQNVRKTDNNTILVLCLQYQIDGVNWVNTRLKLLEIDLSGNVINRLTLNQKNYFVPIDVIKLRNGDYCFLNTYLNYKNNENFLWKVDVEGITYKKVDIPHKAVKTYLDRIFKNHDNGIILLGRNITDEKNIKDFLDDVGVLYILKVNDELEFKWEYSSDQLLLSDMRLREFISLPNNNFIITGYKNKYNFYIAKFYDHDTAMNSIQNNLKKENIFLSPNPATDFLEISLPKNALKDVSIQVYNVFGECIKEIPLNPPFSKGEIKLDVSGLPSGVYFVKVGEKVGKFVKI